MKRKIKKSIVFGLSLKFAGILTAAVLLIIFTFFMFLRHSSIQQETRNFSRTLNQITKAIQSNNPRNLEKRLSELPFFISYIIYNSDTKTVLAKKNDKIDILPPAERKPKKMTQKNHVQNSQNQNDLNIVYMTKTVRDSFGHNITVQILSNGNNNNKFITEMLTLFACASIPILLFSYLLSIYLTKKTISPVVKMTGAAAKISSTNLDFLLPETGTKDELDTLASTFNSLFKRLKADFDRERNFTGDVSHELKTPVAVILGQGNLLRRWGKDDPLQLEKSLNIIISEAKSMETMITNLLQLSKLDSGIKKLQFSTIKCKVFFQRLKNEFETISPDTEIVINCEDSFQFESDEELLHQLFSILISNSIKFSSHTGKIKITAAETNDKTSIPNEPMPPIIHFTVEDEGPGFEDKILPYVFQRFFRGDSAHVRSAGGCGLGLSIAQAIIKNLNGQIKAENTENHHAKMTICLPKENQ